MIKGVHHVAVSVGNLQRLLEFYRDALGFEVVTELDWEAGSEVGDHVDQIVGLKGTAAKIALVRKGALVLEMFEYRSPAPHPVPAGWKVCDHGYTHICLEVEGIEAEYDRLRKFGMTFHSPPPAEPYNGMKAIYGRDPEGNVIELLEVVAAA